MRTITKIVLAGGFDWRSSRRRAAPGATAAKLRPGSPSARWINSQKLFGLTGDTARETMQQSAGNVQALLESSTFVVDGLQNVSGEWMRFVQNRIEENLEHFEEFLGCRTPQECLALQTRVVRDSIEALLQSARRAAEASTKLADDAVRRISDTALAPR